MSKKYEESTPYGVYVIFCRLRHDIGILAITDRWIAWPQPLTKGLPHLYSNESEEHLKKIIDSVMEVPEDKRFKTAEEWNQYLSTQGLVYG